MYWLRTFGGFSIERDGATLDRMRVHRKAHALLAVLAAQGSMGRERLMALLWPESDAERARGSLKQAIHLLRRELDTPDLLLGSAELRLNPERIESDVNLFSRGLERGDVSAAVRHYGGPFLDGVHLDGTGEFERWVDGWRAELARQYLEALEQLARGAETQEEYTNAAKWWRRLQNADPLNSRVAVNLMLALEASGDRAAALQHARNHEALLVEEWGIAPDPAVTELADRLRAPSPPRLVRHEPLAVPAAIGTPQAVSARGPAVPPSLENVEDQAEVPRRRGLGRPAPVSAVILLGVGGLVASLVGMREQLWSGSLDHQIARSLLSSGPLPAPVRGSIAVLPFLDLSPHGDHEYFSHGMTEELITMLSKVQGLRVAARTSSFQFTGSTADLREIRERLGVAHMLEGSIRKAGDRLRITAQLVSTETGSPLWSESYDRQMSDVFAIQEEVSHAIVEALQLQLASDAEASLVAVPTANLAAYELYLRGLHFFNRLQIPQAIEHLEDATRRDPQFARAYAALAEAYTVPAAYGELSPLDARSRGITAAQAAIQLDPSLAEAYAALGWLEMFGFNWQDADNALRRSIELDPHAPRPRFYYAFYLHRQGRWDEAFAQIRHARELDPLSLAANAIYGSFLGDLGRTDEAVAHLQATLELDPAFPIAHAVLGHISLGTGRSGEAIHHYERVVGSFPSSFYAGFLGHAYARAGRADDAYRLLAELKARAARGEHVSPGAIGWILLGLDERSEGFRWLERAAQQRDVFLTVYGVLANRYLSEPYLDDPLFRQLRRNVGLPE